MLGTQAILSEVPQSRTITVPQEGKGNFATISDAIKAAPRLATDYFKIIIKAGIYNEYDIVTEDKPYLVLAGEGIDKTVITGIHKYKDGWVTDKSATLSKSISELLRQIFLPITRILMCIFFYTVVLVSNFVALDITIENRGPEKEQVVAVMVVGDQIVFCRCRFLGYQDTLYAYLRTQFYRDCFIYGTIDFIFGDAAAVIQNCTILVREPQPMQTNTITAQGRGDPRSDT